MERLIEIGYISGKNSRDIKKSKLGLGLEKLDRDMFDPSQCYSKISELGVKWVRIQSGWARTEKIKGVYNFGWLDEIVDNLIAHGLKPWMCLCYGNGLYSELAAETFGAVGVPPIHTPEAVHAWENYVKETVKHFVGRVDTFEIWNEPDGSWCWKTGVNATELGAFTCKTGRYIKEANPEAYVIGGAIGIKGISFLNEAMTAGFGENIDAISFHEYTHDESTVMQIVQALRGLSQLYGYDLEIVSGESGSQSRSDGHGAVESGAWTQRKQAKQLLRHAIADLMANVKFTSYFSCVDMCEALMGTVGDANSYKDYGFFGVLGADFDENGRATGTYTPKLSFRALQVIASLLGEDAELCDVPLITLPQYCLRTWENDVQVKDIVYQGFCKPNGAMAFAYWAPTNIMTTDYETTMSCKLVAKSNDIRLVDLMDGKIYQLPESMCSRDEYNTWTITHLPVKDYPMMLLMGEFE